MNDANGYKYLGPKRGSLYRQFFVLNRMRAETLYLETIGDDARTPQEVAEDFDVPLEAVLEAIRYCEENESLLRQEWEEDEASIRAHGWDKPPVVPPWTDAAP
jgi:hypothetical protein